MTVKTIISSVLWTTWWAIAHGLLALGDSSLGGPQHLGGWLIWLSPRKVWTSCIMFAGSCLAVWSAQWDRESQLHCCLLFCDACSIFQSVYSSPSSLEGYVLWLHYENIPIQIYWKLYHQKYENFQIKNSDILYISAQNIDCGYSLEPPRWGGSN